MVSSRKFRLGGLISKRHRREIRKPWYLQSWQSPFTNVFHPPPPRSNYPYRSLQDDGFEDTLAQSALLRSTYERQQECFLFSKLPGELRNNIYELLLVSSEIITPDQQLFGLSKILAQTHLGGYKPAAGLDATFLQTCRAIHHEAFPILYRKNVFKFNSSLKMMTFRELGLPRFKHVMPSRLPQSIFGTKSVLLWVGRFALLRHVSLSMLPKRSIIRGAFSKQICDLDLESLAKDMSGFPSLEYLDLDFNNAICTEADRFLVLRVIGKARTFGPKRDDGKAVGLLKLTIRGLDFEPLLEELKCLLAPGGKYVVEK